MELPGDHTLSCLKEAGIQKAMEANVSVTRRKKMDGWMDQSMSTGRHSGILIQPLNLHVKISKEMGTPFSCIFRYEDVNNILGSVPSQTIDLLSACKSIREPPL